MVLRVDPRHTSQTCAACGHKDHADLNAAKNILRAGHARLACGTNTSPEVGAKATEPTEAA
jgi:putative transposase